MNLKLAVTKLGVTSGCAVPADSGKLHAANKAFTWADNLSAASVQEQSAPLQGGCLLAEDEDGKEDCDLIKKGLLVLHSQLLIQGLYRGYTGIAAELQKALFCIAWLVSFVRWTSDCRTPPGSGMT